MKIRKRDSLPQANKVFTDREEPRKSFWRMFEKLKANISTGEDIQILTYHGIGGIGKTSLLRQLMGEMNEKIQNPLYAYVDLNIIREPRAVLDALRNILAEKYNFNFPMFDLAVYVYSKKIGEKIQENESEGLIEKSPFLGTVFEVLGEVPIVGLLKKLDKCAGYVKGLIEKRKRDITSIDIEPIEVIYKKLPYYFALDLSDNLENTKIPLVIFLDTYETLVNEMAGVCEPVNNDLWIRGDDGLVQNSARVLWVIAGREKLRWSEINSEWEDSIEQHILGNLAKSDAVSFLNSAGIFDEDLINAIYTLTNGTPVFLDLCVDNYYSIIERGKTPDIEDFKGSTTIIIERFLRYMDDNRKDIIYLLSCMKIWDDEIFNNVAKNVLSGFSFTTYEKIKGASFITKGDEDTYTMHQTVQNVIFADCPEFIRNKAQEELNKYYEQALNNISVASPKFSTLFLRYVNYLLTEKYSEEDFSEIYTKLRQKLDDIKSACQFDLLLSAMKELKEFAEKNFPDSPLMAKIHNDIAGDFSAAGVYDEAVENAELSVKMYREFFGEIDERTLEAIDTLSRSFELSGRSQEAYDVIEKIYANAIAKFGEDNLTVLLLLKELGNSAGSLGKYEEAFKFKKELFEKRKKIFGEDHPETLVAMLNLGNGFRDLECYQEAADIEQKVFEKRIEMFGENNPKTLNAMCNLAITYGRLGRHQEAFELDKKVFEKSTEILGENHPDTVRATKNLAVAYEHLDRYQEALELRQKVFEKRKEILGENHLDTLKALNKVAMCYTELKRYNEALELDKKILDKRIEIQGENHPDTLKAMKNVSIDYDDLEQYQEAFEIDKKILEKRIEISGENHLNTINAMKYLAIDYEHLGRYQEALELRQKVFEKRKEILGEKHPDTIKALKSLAKCYRAAGEIQKAEEIEMRVKSLKEKQNLS